MDLDLSEILEGMASKVTSPVNDFEKEAKRWTRPFGFTREKARYELKTFRENIAQNSISEQSWEMVRQSATREGHSKESYEYYMQSPISETEVSAEPPTADQACPRSDVKFLMKLEGPLSSLDQLRDVFDQDFNPSILVGKFDDESDTGTEAEFILLDWSEKNIIAQHFKYVPSFKPTLIRISVARKDLSDDSIYPTLGRDATLPQFRPATTAAQQDTYPVCYFFYGTLCDPERLVQMLGLEKAPQLERAFVTDGALKTWAGKYKALVDGEERVDGKAFWVQTKEQEDALRHYETGKYEVVRCDITVVGEAGVEMEKESSRIQKGLTFRFDSRYL